MTSLWLFFAWQLIRLPLQATPEEWAQGLVQLTPESWSSHSHDAPHEPSSALTPTDPGGVDDLGSSAPWQMLAPARACAVRLGDPAPECPPEPHELHGDEKVALGPTRWESEHHQPFPGLAPPLESPSSRNFQGNIISYVDKSVWNVWNTDRWAEKLILSENYLTELHKNSFKGLLSLQHLVLPSPVACCLCRLQEDIEAVCTAVKLHCPDECLTNTLCCVLPWAGNPQAAFLQTLQARRRDIGTELMIASKVDIPVKRNPDVPDSVSQQPDLAEKSDVLRALDHIVPAFPASKPEDADSGLLPFIRRLLPSPQEEDRSSGHLKNNPRDFSVKLYKRKLRKVHFLEKLVNTEIEQNTDEVKKRKKAAVPMQALLGPKWKRQIFLQKLASAGAQQKGLAPTPSTGPRLQREETVVQGPKQLRKRRQSVRAPAESTTQGRLGSAGAGEQGELRVGPALRTPAAEDAPEAGLAAGNDLGNSLADSTALPEEPPTASATPGLPVAAASPEIVTTKKMQRGPGMGRDVPSTPTGITYPLQSSAGDQLESQLNQQLRSLIPNRDVRQVISLVIRTLKVDCADAQVQQYCAKFVSRTGLLLKLLSERQQDQAAKAGWDPEQWEADSESTGAESDAKRAQSSELKNEVLNYTLDKNLIIEVCATAAVMAFLMGVCLNEICAHRARRGEGTDRAPRKEMARTFHETPDEEQVFSKRTSVREGPGGMAPVESATEGESEAPEDTE